MLSPCISDVEADADEEEARPSHHHTGFACLVRSVVLLLFLVAVLTSVSVLAP